jgi:hypothetical protein
MSGSALTNFLRVAFGLPWWMLVLLVIVVSLGVCVHGVTGMVTASMALGCSRVAVSRF